MFRYLVATIPRTSLFLTLSLLAGCADPSPQVQTAPAPLPQTTVQRQAAAPQLASVVTASEIEGVRNKIRPCWNTIGGGRSR
jgi:hypothetical protein